MLILCKTEIFSKVFMLPQTSTKLRGFALSMPVIPSTEGLKHIFLHLENSIFPCNYGHDTVFGQWAK